MMTWPWFAVALLAAFQWHVTGLAQIVPPVYESLYGQLSHQLDVAEKTITTTSMPHRTMLIGGQLLVADGNRGTILLEERTKKSVDVNLDALKKLGLSLVKITASYPSLNADYPRNQEYLAFYQYCVKAAHERGMKVLMQTTSAFRDPTYGHLDCDISGLTFERYMQQKKAMIRRVVSELRPDFLTMENEPDTQQRNTGLEFSLTNYVRLIRAELEGLDHRGVMIGAGAGSWSKLEVFEALAGTNLDYLDVHVYPIGNDMLIPKLEQISRVAREHRKQWLIGECWLYKTDANGGYGDYQNIYKRDAYSFWSPLDVRFIQLVPQLACGLGAQGVDFFWVNYCFGNLDYSREMEALSTREIMQKTNRIAGPRMIQFQLTDIGESLLRVAQQYSTH